MTNQLSAKDLKFVVHIEGREAVEIEAYEDGNPDQILVDAAFMKMARAVNDLINQRAELLGALKKCRFDSLNQSIDEWREIQSVITKCESEK